MSNCLLVKKIMDSNLTFEALTGSGLTNSSGTYTTEKKYKYIFCIGTSRTNTSPYSIWSFSISSGELTTFKSGADYNQCYCTWAVAKDVESGVTISYSCNNNYREGTCSIFGAY